MLIIIIKSIIIGALGGAAVAAGAARMFKAPEVQAMGAFRTMGELNACKGDPVAHFTFGLGFFFNAAGAVVGSGALTQDVLHRIIPNWSAGVLMLKNKNVEETLYHPGRMAVVGAAVGAVSVAALNSIASLIPASLSAIAQGILGPASAWMIDIIMPILFILAAMDAGRVTGIWGLALGGVSHVIMGNATPGAVLGIIIGQTIQDNGFSKSVKVMVSIVVVLFGLIGYFRGFWGNLFTIVTGIF